MSYIKKGKHHRHPQPFPTLKCWILQRVSYIKKGKYHRHPQPFPTVKYWILQPVSYIKKGKHLHHPQPFPTVKYWILQPVFYIKKGMHHHHSQHTNAVSHHQCPIHRARGRTVASCSQCQSLRTKDRGASSMGPSSHTTVITVAARVRLVGPASSITEMHS